MENNSIDLNSNLLQEDDRFEEEKLISHNVTPYPDLKEEPLRANDIIHNYEQKTNEYQAPQTNQVQPNAQIVK